jgi:hypothetical protein
VLHLTHSPKGQKRQVGKMAGYKVPTLFLNDHLNRCDDCYENPIKVIAKGKLLSDVELDENTYQDLKSDADFYADMFGSDDYEENKSIVNSAINTLKRLVQSNG